MRIRTNASTGGGGSASFTAYIQVTTDASASITATNLAGNTYTGTADSTGALLLEVNDAGTYTVSITGTTFSNTVAVIDNGASYSVTVFSEYVLFNSTINRLGSSFLYGDAETRVIVEANDVIVLGRETARYYPAYTNGKYDLTNMKELKITGFFEKYTHNLEFGFCDNTPQAMGGSYKTGDQNVVVSGTFSANATYDDTVILDVSSITGEHYFYFKSQGNDSSSTTYVNRLMIYQLSMTYL